MSTRQKGSKGINLNYTQSDWNILELVSEKRGYPSFRSYLNSALHGMARSVDADMEEIISCEECNKTRNLYYIPEDIAPKIEFLARIKCMPVAAYVKAYIIEPLMREHDLANRS